MTSRSPDIRTLIKSPDVPRANVVGSFTQAVLAFLVKDLCPTLLRVNHSTFLAQACVPTVPRVFSAHLLERRSLPQLLTFTCDDYTRKTTLRNVGKRKRSMEDTLAPIRDNIKLLVHELE